VLRRLIGAVEAGELDADSPKARVLLRHLEGAVTMLETMLIEGAGKGG
jgi:hypothetical protein